MAVILAAVTVYAQRSLRFSNEDGYYTAGVPADVLDNPANAPYLGLRFGLDVTCPGSYSVGKTKLDLYGNGAGFHAGAVYNIPCWKNLYFEPGLLLYYNTMGSDLTTDADGNEDGHISVRRFGVRVPMVAGYRFDFEPVRISVSTGLQLDLGLWGRNYLTEDTLNTSESSSCYGDSGSLHRANLGWKFGVGAEWRNFVLELSGTVGMLNMAKGSDDGFKVSYHENLFQLSLGYNF